MSENARGNQAEEGIRVITDPAEDVLGGENARGEVAGCPTGLSLPDRTPEAQEQPGHEFKPAVEELKGSEATGRAK